MAESSPYRDDRTPEEQALGSDASASARPNPEVCLEISEVRVEETGPQGRAPGAPRGGAQARATLRVRLDDVAHLIDHLLNAAPHLLDHLTPTTATPPPRTPRHAFPTTPHSTNTPRTAGTPASAARGGGAWGGRPMEGGEVRRGWPRGGAPSWRPERKHAGDLGAATGRTIHHAAPGEEAPHTVPGHEVLDVETHAGTAARPMTEQAARHGDASHPTPPTRPYFAPDEGTLPDEPPTAGATPYEPSRQGGTYESPGVGPSRQAQDVMPSPADSRSGPARPAGRDPGPGRSRTPHTGVGPRPGLDPPPQEPSHPGLAHRIPSQPGPRPRASAQPAHAPHASTQQQPGRPAARPGSTPQEWTRPHVPPQGTAQPRPGRTPAPPDTEPEGPARPEGAGQPRPGRSTSPRPAGLYRPGLDPPPQSAHPHDQGIPRPTRSDRVEAGGVAQNEAASGNGVASERLGGVAAGWS
ncbi:MULTISPECIES: hypothetical protein [unclassified Nonomuraea]|uniref:hypothetical protein n=1 Tax=unclassified Nonomuraea TaxID=2593643 RepID=UPI0033F4C831